MQLAVNEIWQNFHKELYGFIFSKVKSKPDSDDILQEVFLKVMNNIEKVNGVNNLRAYLFTIVKNAINDYYRTTKNTSHLESSEIEELSIEENENLNLSIANNCLKPMINQLPVKYRDALVLTELNEMSQKDLAIHLDISYSGAKSRVQRGKEKLKELILNCCVLETDSYGNVVSTDKSKCKCN